MNMLLGALATSLVVYILILASEVPCKLSCVRLRDGVHGPPVPPHHETTVMQTTIKERFSVHPTPSKNNVLEQYCATPRLPWTE